MTAPRFPHTAIWLVGFAALVLTATLPVAAAAMDDPCPGLTKEQQKAAAEVITSVYPHECCDTTLAECLGADHPDRLAVRLAKEICRRIVAGQKPAEVKRGIERRGASMMPALKPPKMNLTEIVFAGEPEAPVEIVAYVCARCPFCSKIVPALYSCVTEGELRGKARLAVRLFPIRGHEHSTEGGLAVQAALKLGTFWPFLLEVYRNFDAFTPELVPKLAAAVGLDVDAHAAAMKDPAVRAKLVDSKKEGLRLGVEATPTFYINGKKYRDEATHEAVHDAILEEWERATGVLCEGADGSR